MRRRGACGRPCSRPRIGLRPKAPKASARSLSATSTSAANGWRSHRMRQPRPRHQADAKGRGRRILIASAHSSPLPSQAALQAAILWPCPPARQHPRPLARSHPSRTPLRQTPRRRRRLWTPLPPRLLRQTPRRRRGSACQRPRHSRARQSTVGGPPLGFCQTHMRSWRRSSDRLVGRAPVRLRADGARDRMPWDWSWSSCWRSRCSEPGAGGSESLSRGAQLWRLPAVPSDSSLSDTRSPQNQSGKPPQWAAPAETERAAAGVAGLMAFDAR